MKPAPTKNNTAKLSKNQRIEKNYYSAKKTGQEMKQLTLF
jgi:hypothetical protein